MDLLGAGTNVEIILLEKTRPAGATFNLGGAVLRNVARSVPRSLRRLGESRQPTLGAISPAPATSRHASPTVMKFIGVIAWLSVIGAGTARLMQYESRPGAASHPPLDWPMDSRLPRHHGEPILLMFVHPRCPCSRASLDELVTVLRKLPQRVRACVVFCRPAGFSDDSMKTDLWIQARSIRGVEAVCGEADERTRFSVFTSGQVLFYDERGILRFRGGITRARGVGGAGQSRNALISAIARQTDRVTEAAVFGCPLSPAGKTTPEDCGKRPMR